MKKGNLDSKKTPFSTESEKKSFREAVRQAMDQTEGQLFVPHLEALELPVGLESTQDMYPSLLETICGVTDDSQPVEQYTGTLGVTTAFVAAHQVAAVQVQWNNNLAAIYTNPGNVSGVRWGSGTMISGNLLLTCGHLFDQTGGGWERPRVNGTTNIISPQDIARNMRVNFNYQVDPSGNLRTEQSFAITDLIEYRLGGIDMAICRVSGNPGATFGTTRVSTTDAASPDMICIIGHPAGLPKRIEAGPTTSISGNFIHYNDIDTLGGNSGSGILRAGDGLLVGIHTNGGCNASSPGGTGSNFGQRIAAVIAISPTLTSLVRPKIKVADDVVVKFKAADDGSKFKASDDVPKFKASDDVSKFKVRDDILKIKFRDDVKTPMLDKRPGFEGKNPGFDNKSGFDGSIRVDPGRIRHEVQSVKPFILSTPHHSNAWQTMSGQSLSPQEEMENILVQYQQAIATAEENLQQLVNEYRDIYAQYESLNNGGQQI